MENNLCERVVLTDILRIRTHAGGYIDKYVHVLFRRLILIKVNGFCNILYVRYDIINLTQKIIIVRCFRLVSTHHTLDHSRPHQKKP